MNNLNLWLGFTGMLMLLAAFGLNLAKIRTESSRLYIWLNILGAGISAFYAVTLEAYPFVILEAVWCGFAVYKLMVVMSAKS